MTRSTRAIALVLALSLTAAALLAGGCTSKTEIAQPPAEKPAAIKIGTLATEDSLPLVGRRAARLLRHAGL